MKKNGSSYALVLAPGTTRNVLTVNCPPGQDPFGKATSTTVVTPGNPSTVLSFVDSPPANATSKPDTAPGTLMQYTPATGLVTEAIPVDPAITLPAVSMDPHARAEPAAP